MSKIALIVFCVAWSIASVSCAKKDTAADNSNVTTGISTNLAGVSSGFTPGSLKSSSALVAMLDASPEAASSDPCAGKTFTDCQPILIREYIKLAKASLDAAKSVVDSVGTGLGKLADGASGTHTEGTDTIDYNKTSDTDFSILYKKNSKAGLYLKVKGNVYTLQMDVNAVDPTQAAASIQVDVTFTDANTWTVTTFFYNSTCSTAKPNDPNRIKVVIGKASGLWTGKAMLYMPHLREATPSCSTTESDTTGAVYYTDFAADDTAAKAHIYFMKRTRLASEISDTYSMTHVETELGVDVDASTTQTALTGVENQVCMTPTTATFSTGTSAGAQCTPASTAVSAASYGASTDWTSPSSFFGATVTLPSAL